MQFWEGGVVRDLLFIGLMILISRQAFRAVPALRRLAVPPVLVAGALGLILGPGGLDLVPFGTGTLESIAYHGLAIVFVAVGLRKPAPGTQGRGARSIAFAVPVIILTQALLGLGLVLAWNAAGQELHPGFGMMLPLGFSQGPGQAIAMGGAWENMGMQEGAQVGLAMATAGYACCCAFGLVLFVVARRLGWLDPVRGAADPGAGPAHGAPAEPEEATTDGDMEPLTANIAVVCAIYLVTFGLLSLGADALADKPQLGAAIWGFHFIVALGLAIVARTVSAKVAKPDFTNDRHLTSIAGVAVDFSAASAIAAVRLDVLGDYIVPIVVLSILGVLLTGGLCIWFARRAFPVDPFSHALVLFGTLTGTLPTGFVLLRLADPKLEGIAARNMVMGETGAIMLSLPLLLVLLPMPVMGWPESYPGAVWQAFAGCAVYVVALIVAWRLFGPLRFRGPLLHPWPALADSPKESP